jgi:hypothetical protein
MGVHSIAEHTKEFWNGYWNGSEVVVSDQNNCKTVLMPDHESCTNVRHFQGLLVATSGPSVVHCDKKGVCSIEAPIRCVLGTPGCSGTNTTNTNATTTNKTTTNDENVGAGGNKRT